MYPLYWMFEPCAVRARAFTSHVEGQTLTGLQMVQSRTLDLTILRIRYSPQCTSEYVQYGGAILYAKGLCNP